MARLGVFICYCGENIARTVDVEKVRENVQDIKGVIVAKTFKYMCSNFGQELIKNTIKEFNLDRIVVAACSPRMHLKTFQNVLREAGLNPYLCEMANIREQCSWVHEDRNEATEKATALIKSAIYKNLQSIELTQFKIGVTKRALVLGGGVAGIETALTIANSGYEVILVEKEPSIGGNMSRLSETFPTMDCSQCILTPKMVDVLNHPKIELLTYSELTHVEGFVGNFKIKVKKKARSIKEDVCTSCGLCTTKCPQKNIKSEFELGLSNRRAIYVPFPQAVPAFPVIDREHCTKFKTGKCGVCAAVCTIKAIDFEQKDQELSFEVGAIVIATGLRNVDTKEVYPEYGYGRYKNVLNGLEFERLCSASGPTNGEIKKPSDGKTPEKIVFIACAGSRDKSCGYPYCSKICCMYTTKHARIYKHKNHHGKAYVFYMDIRTPGKNYDEFSRKVIEEDEVDFIRGRVSKIYEEGDKLIVKGTDTLIGRNIQIDADMVVLATPMVANLDVVPLSQMLRISIDENKFFLELHPKLQPVETATQGIFLSGSCNGPKDISEAVTSAMGAASKVLQLFSMNEIAREPIVAYLSDKNVKENCTGCFTCENACPYKAIIREDVLSKDGKVLRQIAKVNEALCEGCGTCTNVCRAMLIDMKSFSDKEMYGSVISFGEEDDEEE